MIPWKAALATMVIFVCGLVTGVLLEKKEGARQFAALEAAGAALPAGPVSPAAPTNAVVTRTNVVWASAQAQRMAFLRQMVNRLHLEPEQHARVLEVLKESQERSKGIWQQIAPQMRDELKRTTDEIRAQLSPEQQRRFTEMLRERRQENRARMEENRARMMAATNMGAGASSPSLNPRPPDESKPSEQISTNQSQ